MSRKFFSVLALTLVCLSAWSQTVVWQMPLSDYSDITRIGDNLYMVSRNGKTGLINSDGSVVSPAEIDAIIGFYENKALLISNDGNGERIVGCLTSDGRYYPYSKRFYTLSGQKFFSDGYLSVADENGRVGYIDMRGNQMLGFDGKYDRIKPFTEGYAAVRRNKKYILINKDGDEVTFTYGGSGVGAEIGGCSNVYKGTAYVYDVYSGPDRSYFLYNALSKGNLKKTGKVKNTSMDYLYCYQSVTGRPKEVPLEKVAFTRGAIGLDATMSNGLFGYFNSGTPVAPNQFTKASAFEDGAAIVGLSGKLGILKYVDGPSFSASAPSGSKNFYAGKSVPCTVNLSVPNVWRDKKLHVILKDQNGSAITANNVSAGTYSFEARPSVTGQISYTLVVYGDELKLYEDVLTYSFAKIEVCRTCGKDIGACPYKGKHPVQDNREEEKTCPTCGKKISQCEYLGVH